MASFEFELSNLDGVLDRLQRFGQDVVDAADAAIAEAASEGASLVEANAPVLTGKLRASVTHTHVGWGIAVIAVGENIPYTRPQEARSKFLTEASAWFRSTA